MVQWYRIHWSSLFSSTAEVYIGIGKPAEATACTQEAANLFPMSHYVLYMRGQVAELRGNIDEAKRWYEEALSISPTHVKSMQRLVSLKSMLMNYFIAICGTGFCNLKELVWLLHSLWVLDFSWIHFLISKVYLKTIFCGFLFSSLPVGHEKDLEAISISILTEFRKRIYSHLPNTQSHWEIKVDRGRRRVRYHSLDEISVILITNSWLKVEFCTLINYMLIPIN